MCHHILKRKWLMLNNSSAKFLFSEKRMEWVMNCCFLYNLQSFSLFCLVHSYFQGRYFGIAFFIQWHSGSYKVLKKRANEYYQFQLGNLGMGNTLGMPYIQYMCKVRTVRCVFKNRSRFELLRTSQSHRIFNNFETVTVHISVVELMSRSYFHFQKSFIYVSSKTV